MPKPQILANAQTNPAIRQCRKDQTSQVKNPNRLFICRAVGLTMRAWRKKDTEKLLELISSKSRKESGFSSLVYLLLQPITCSRNSPLETLCACVPMNARVPVHARPCTHACAQPLLQHTIF